MLLACIVFLTSCGAVVGNDTTSRHERADAINEQAYKKRYVSLAETEHLAEQALQLSGDYSDGQYEALCHQAFVLSMRTDYAGAKLLYRQVTKEAKNELFVLLADIGLMDLSQRTSSNKEYYDYRNDAQRRLNRLSGSVETMNAHQLRLWNYATSEYHFVSAVYYFYMNQRHEAAAEMLTVTNNTDCIRNDTGQIAKYCYLTGSGGLIESDGTAQAGSETDDIHPTSKEENRNLMRCLSISTNKGITFFLASVLQSCADNILNAPD